MTTEEQSIQQEEEMIYKRMCDLHADIDGLTKGDYNKMQKFNFRGIDSVYNYLHSKMSKYKIFSVPTFLRDLGTEERKTKSGGLLLFRRYEIKYTFYTDDGSKLESILIGEAQDSGDKASNKCFAIAHKYALLQIFSIPTEEQKDPDSENVEIKDDDKEKRFEKWVEGLAVENSIIQGWVGEVDAVGCPFDEYTQEQMDKFVALWKESCQK